MAMGLLYLRGGGRDVRRVCAQRRAVIAESQKEGAHQKPTLLMLCSWISRPQTWYLSLPFHGILLLWPEQPQSWMLQVTLFRRLADAQPCLEGIFFNIFLKVSAAWTLSIGCLIGSYSVEPKAPFPVL